ncbi:aldose epimerase family protein [Undibacterium squillarum]|uniref:Putative glucose-6-phosphate 1-epimerase n=1 Tax=Undibacterium squillarum TaxID=1131567 RepID=A0ABQ2XV59_9BURK|nr:hypothetical protein [Undibacterium squillarum]GGX35802.1 D-hexose-6-phosphate mutarotase [Undibacterium squillarum]
MIKIGGLQNNFMGPVLLYTAGGAQCTILREGANLVSWIPANGEEQLFISRCSGTVAGLPVRGGIPLVFPQFAEMGPLPKHGILRNVIWDLIAISSQPDCATATLQTEFRAYALPGWPHPFRARLVVELQDHAVFLQFSIQNTGTRTFAFQSAMHTYLRLPGGTPVDIHGCIPANYFDKQLQTWCEPAMSAPLHINAATDQIHQSPATRLQCQTGAGRVTLQSGGFPETVIWTPWREGAAAIPDLADDEGDQFICIEPAAIYQAQELAPGSQWQGRLCLVAEAAPESETKPVQEPEPDNCTQS